MELRDPCEDDAVEELPGADGDVLVESLAVEEEGISLDDTDGVSDIGEVTESDMDAVTAWLGEGGVPECVVDGVDDD